MSITIVLPERSEDEISEGLRALTRALAAKGVNVSAGALGGRDGYGADFANHAFSMHPYCYCEQSSCPWCSRGTPNFIHLDSHSCVWWYKWIGRSQEARLSRPWADILSDCFASLEGEP